MSRSLFKTTSLVSSMTMISRILGLIRDMVIAHVFGATAEADAFWVAFKIPNFMRRLFAEGAFSQAFVPVLSEYKEQCSEQEMQLFAANIFGSLAATLLLTTLIGILAAPAIIAIFAPGFVDDPIRYSAATAMLRVTFPYIFFISLTAYAAGVLNTFNRFAIPAFTPVLLNISLIAVALLMAPRLNMPIMALAWGVFIAGIAQFCFQLPFLWRIGMLRRPRWGWQDPGVRRVLKLMAPAILGVSVTQLSILLDTIFASFLQVGSVTWLYYSDRLMSFPLGVFGVAIATVILPKLSRQHSRGKPQDYHQTLDWSIRLVLLIGVPSAVALLLFAGPLLSSLFQSGHFNARDVLMSRESLMAYSLGIPAFMLIKVFASGFYAQQDIKTPVRIAIIAVVVNMVFNAMLIWPLAHAGLALATSIAAFVNAGLLLRGLLKRGIFQPLPGWRKFFMQLFVATTLMGVMIDVMSANTLQWTQWHWQQRLSHLVIIVPLAMVVYSVSLWLMGMRWQQLKGEVTS